jgi:hypothetical protein
MQSSDAKDENPGESSNRIQKSLNIPTAYQRICILEDMLKRDHWFDITAVIIRYTLVAPEEDSCEIVREECSYCVGKTNKTIKAGLKNTLSMPFTTKKSQDFNLNVKIH